MKVKFVLAAVAVMVSTSGAFAQSGNGASNEWRCLDFDNHRAKRACINHVAPNQPKPMINTLVIYVSGTDKLAGKQGIPGAPLPARGRSRGY